ncbi:hypothetical protein CORC01_01152 [Colletotrichum orchidophilum]|uniref:Uncharacterized protein n=1 Tax=Colletotrichum orchidophilum TaxID=1209926 RepID=A0A1G4BQ42_9PEZI|nr:uncharacterized protein CORC01_01152 [Colletotrichum orchidophilum]OHF03433.1 hypothetical protein CORC01_01152 [Colletotrichum orchidophilum]
MHQRIKAYGAVDGEEDLCRHSRRDCVCTITLKKRVDLRFEFFCVVLQLGTKRLLVLGSFALWDGDERVFRIESPAIRVWESVIGRSMEDPKGATKTSQQETRSYSLRAASVIRRGSSEMFHHERG